jgi:hypothetical protein
MACENVAAVGHLKKKKIAHLGQKVPAATERNKWPTTERAQVYNNVYVQSAGSDFECRMIVIVNAQPPIRVSKGTGSVLKRATL